VAAPTAGVDQLAARDSGATAGVSEAGGQQVFTSSKAGKSDSGGKTATRDSSRVTPSESTALSDAWSGYGSGATVSGSSTPAAASLGEEGSGSTLGLFILGLGLVGMLGAFALAVPRRRRVKASGQ